MAGKYHSKPFFSYQTPERVTAVGACELQALTIFDQPSTRVHISTSDNLQLLGIWLALGFEPRTSQMKTSALLL